MAKKFSDLAGACWKGYKAVGLKNKNGRKVPNCVPVNETALNPNDPHTDYAEKSKVLHQLSMNKDVDQAQVTQRKLDLDKEYAKHKKDLEEAKKDEEETVDRVERSDYKVSASGRKSHKQIVFKMGDEEMKESTVPAKNTDVSDKSWLKDAGKKPSIKSDLKNFKNFLTGKKETNEEVEQVMEAAPFKTKEDAVKYAKEKVKTHRDNLDGIEIYAHSGGFDVNHTMNASGRNSLQKIKAKHIGTIYKEEVEMEEGYYQKPASAYRRKGDEIGGGSSKNDVPFDGPYTKTKPAKNSDGTTQSPMSRARELAKQAIAASRLEQKAKNKIKEDVVDEQAPVAPVPDKKYIKGTPENKAYKATKKPINGMPTNVKEEADQIDELNKTTLASYAYKAAADAADKARDAERRAASAKDAEKRAKDPKLSFAKSANQAVQKHEMDRSVSASKKSASRVSGVLKAASKLAYKEEVEQIEEANHREFASQGKMHPDMAKHMSVGQEMDYYEHGTGDKVSGKVLKNDGKEVHMKQTHDSYDPKKKGTVHKFTVSSKLDEKAPPGFEGTVKAMKKHKEIDNPYALAWYMKNKGMKSHKEEFDDNGELITNMKSYKEFLESLDEVKMSDLPSRKVSGKYGTEYYKGEAEKDVKGYDDEDTPAKPAGEKRGRGRPAGSTSGARQKGTIAKRKGSGVEMTGYPVHLPNFK